LPRSGGSIEEEFFPHEPSLRPARRWFGVLAAIAALGLPSLVSADSVSLGVGSEPLQLS
jgi:hypothetical protein